ncbi:MAG: V-type ATP synthase subunit I [Anaerolineae bacterium]
MFVPAEMSEVDIFVYENDIEMVAQTVASLGIMHLLNPEALGDWAASVGSEWAGRIATYSAQERRLIDVLGQLNIPIKSQPMPPQLRPAEDVAPIEEALQHAEASVRELRNRHDDVRRDLEHWELVAKSLLVLEPLSISLSDLSHMEHLHVVAGTIPPENLARLEASLFRIPYTIIPVYNHKHGELIFAFCSEEHAPILDRALESAFLDPLELPTEYGGTPQEVLAKVDENVKQGHAQLAEIETNFKALSDQLSTELLSLLTQVRGDRAIADAMSHFGHRGHVYLVAGWVPKDHVAELHSAIDRVTENRATVEENSPYVAGQQLKVPTLLRNVRLFRPAESLVTIYGTPDYNELDPTPLLAVTFVIMFGAMFGDLGQGMVIALSGLVLMRRWIPQVANLASVGAILFACGLSSSVFGLLYGSFFGLETVIPHLWLKPMNSIMSLLLASVIFGVVVINIGFIFRMLTAIRAKSWKDAIVDRNGIIGVLLYWGLGGIVVYTVIGRHIPIALDILVPLLSIALFLAKPLTRMLKQQKPVFEGSVGESLIQSFFEFFETIISYISNTLSFVRLGAFAVAHMGLSMAFVILSQMVDTSTHIAVMGVFILIVGNLFILGLEGLIVGIQTLRLEYYELFGKFFNGGGVPFKPLTLPSVKYEIVTRKRSDTV